MNEKSNVKIVAKIKVEKYPVGTTQEEIALGLVQPEIITSEDILIDNPNEPLLQQLDLT
jgi:hypothetical protein